MKIVRKAAFALPIVIGLVLSGCASPNIMLKPPLPAPAAQPVSAGAGPVWLVVAGTEAGSRPSRYEERGDKTQIGRSESLGVHLSDLWMEEPPPVFVKRMLENNLKAWGYQVATSPQKVQLHGLVNKFSLDNRAINIFEFQADGVIDVELSVAKDGLSTYKERYVGTCTFRTATEIPGQERMEKLFNACVAEFQKRLDGDNRLRAALSAQ